MTLSQDAPRIDASKPASPSAEPSALNLKPANLFLPLGRQQQSILIPGTQCLVRPQVPLSTLTSFKVGGPAEFYVSPRTTSDLQATLAWAKAQSLPITLLGAGSNLLVSDRGIPGLVISTRHLRSTHFDAKTGQVTAGAGEPIPRLAWQLAELGWQGFEWAVGIPGTLGGAVVMNAGAHSSCLADSLVHAQILTLDGSLETCTPANLGYSYRTSNLQLGPSTPPQDIRLVTQATLQLQPGTNPEEVLATTTEHLNQRKNTQPYHLPSCGSVFRNPAPYKAGWLIEQAGLKGHQIGGAQIAQRHANFILNCGGATATDIFQLIQYIQQTVEQAWSLRLEPEVKMLGEFQVA